MRGVKFTGSTVGGKAVATIASFLKVGYMTQNILELVLGITQKVLSNHVNKKDKQYSNSIRLQLDYPTNNNILIVKKAIEAIKRIYKAGYRYKKAGIILYELHDSFSVRGLLDYNRPRSDSLMKSLDSINNRYGSSTLKIAAEGIEKEWKMQRKKISPCYTTRFNELKIVRS